jgi:hypothetical protein
MGILKGGVDTPQILTFGGLVDEHTHTHTRACPSSLVPCDSEASLRSEDAHLIVLGYGGLVGYRIRVGLLV